MSAEEQHAGAQPDCSARAQTPAGLKLGLQDKVLSSLLLLSPAEPGDGAPTALRCHRQVWAGAAEAGELWEATGEVQGVQSSWRSWRFANSELGTWWV